MIEYNLNIEMNWCSTYPETKEDLSPVPFIHLTARNVINIFIKILQAKDWNEVTLLERANNTLPFPLCYWRKRGSPEVAFIHPD